MTATDQPTVLVVDDEASYTALLAEWLADDYRVRTAHSGTEALEKLDDTVSVMLLDRRMPDRSGDEVLSVVRDRGLHCRVAMVTAVEPSFDVVELGFDDYLVKPTTRAEITSLVDSLLHRATYQREVQQLFALASKRAMLERRHSEAELRSSDRYSDLTAEVEALRTRLEDVTTSLTDEEYEAVFRELDADVPRVETGWPNAGDAG